MLESVVSELPEGLAWPSTRIGERIAAGADGSASWMDAAGGFDVLEGLQPRQRRCRGFCGWLKVETSREADWERGTVAEFEVEFADCMDRCNRRRIKASLGGMSLCNYRESLGLAA